MQINSASSEGTIIKLIIQRPNQSTETRRYQLARAQTLSELNQYIRRYCKSPFLLQRMLDNGSLITINTQEIFENALKHHKKTSPIGISTPFRLVVTTFAQPLYYTNKSNDSHTNSGPPNSEVSNIDKIDLPSRSSSSSSASSSSSSTSSMPSFDEKMSNTMKNVLENSNYVSQFSNSEVDLTPSPPEYCNVSAPLKSKLMVVANLEPSLTSNLSNISNSIEEVDMTHADKRTDMEVENILSSTTSTLPEAASFQTASESDLAFQDLRKILDIENDSIGEAPILRKAAETINKLREEMSSLHLRLDSLETSVMRLRLDSLKTPILDNPTPERKLIEVEPPVKRKLIEVETPIKPKLIEPEIPAKSSPDSSFIFVDDVDDGLVIVSPYQDQLALLAERGHDLQALNESLLNAYEGNVQEVLRVLASLD